MAVDLGVPTLHWVDYFVFSVFLLASSGIGVFYGYQSKKNAKTQTTKSFLTGDGNMPVIPVGLSMMASFLSAIFVLGTPAEIYSFGVTQVYVTIAYITGFGLAAHVHLPVFYRLGVTSGYEYLERRYNKAVRIAGAVTFSIMILIYLPVVLYTPALALNQVTQMPMMASILGVGAVCTFYTALGGLKATIWNDAFQMMILLICFLIILILGTAEAGGIINIFERAQVGGRLDTSFDPNPFLRATFWSHTIGGTFINITLYASSQTIIQKFLSTRSIREGQKAVWLSSIINAGCMVMVFLLGIIMYAYYEHCDPVASGKAQKSDQVRYRKVTR